MGQLISPTGVPVIGTSDTIPGIALTSGWTKLPSGAIEPDHAGETKVNWDGQETKAEPGGVIYVVDEDGREHLLTACTYVEEDSEP